MSTFITKRRLATIASMAAVVATSAVAIVPAASVAASSCAPTGFTRDGIELTAARIGGAITGTVDATGCDIAVFDPTSVTNADIHGARYFGVVVDDSNANVTNSKIHQIGETPFDGTQHGNAVLYINGATGTISGNRIYDFQKNGIIVDGRNADASGPAARKTSATIAANDIAGEGAIDYIAQNGIVVRDGATALVKGNTVHGFVYTPDTNDATGLLNYQAEKVTVSGNRFVGTETAIYGPVTANVGGAATVTVRPHAVRFDFRSTSKPAPDATLGTKLDWKVKVDGKYVLHIKQAFADQDTFIQRFRWNSGKHTVKVFKNDVLVRSLIVRS